ncbi:putative IQ motif, EF-hand binding protein [Helianthus debilis subsp. tardiflorus]
MGRSGGYCFKIIACGSNSESVDRDDLDASVENKGSDKRGWSFRKRSAGHRVLSNNVITEISSSVNKSSEPVIINSEAPISSVSEKTSANELTEELPHVSTSTTKGNTPSNLVTEAADVDESKFDSGPDESSVIVIQAAVRRFLAQRELMRHKKAVKLQAAVRGHLVRCRAAGTLRCIQSIIKMQALVRVRHANTSLEKTSIGKKAVQDSRNKTHPTYISIEKLLSNRFANQLLESTPRTKQINIKCNPSNDDSAWKWLERWTSVSSPQVTESHALKHQQDNTIDTKNQIGNMNSGQNPENVSKHVNTGPEVGPTSLPAKHSLEAEQPKRPAKRVATEQADSEGRKSAFGSRKASNPTFIAAHSKFEELTSKNSSFASVGSSNQEHVAKQKPHTSSIQLKNVEPRESVVYESLKVGQSPTVGSECGTELSVTSMLDSPDPSEVGNVENIENEKEAKSLDKEADDGIKSISVKEHALLNTALTHCTSDLSENEKYDCNTDISQVKQSHEDESYETSNADIETHIHHQASPRSHVIAPETESHGTPSSQISTNNKTKTDRKTSGQKSKPWSNSTKSPVSSGLRNSLDNLPRERRSGNRRNSFGSQSSDQEPRDSSSSNSIPSYMQVTESARAKALANSSPRSSPDVQVKEGYLKKRHSLPGAVNSKHDSPRVMRTSPQAQQPTKGNNNPERKWQR